MPYFLSVSVSSEYSLSARETGMPSHTRMRITITAASHVWPARSRTKHSSFSSLQLLRTTCSGHHSTPTPPPQPKQNKGHLQQRRALIDVCIFSHIWSQLGWRLSAHATCLLLPIYDAGAYPGVMQMQAVCSSPSPGHCRQCSLHLKPELHGQDFKVPGLHKWQDKD